MEATDLRQYSPEELTGRIRQWKEELFHLKFKMQSNEARDTSVVQKLRRDIARAQTVLGEKARGVVVTSTKPAKSPKPKKAASDKAEQKAAAADVPAKKEAKTKKAAPDKKKKKE